MEPGSDEEEADGLVGDDLEELEKEQNMEF
jgi:hypothetical protein